MIGQRLYDPRRTRRLWWMSKAATAGACVALATALVFALLAVGGCAERPSRGQQVIDGMRPAIFGPGAGSLSN